MPYSNAALSARKDATGQVQLPLARVKKIVSLDPDVAMCSNTAAFVISLATEMFIQNLAEQGHNVVKSERKPRRNIQYRDLATAIGRNDSLEFLVDTVPQTTTYGQVRKARENPDRARAHGAGSATIEAGQTTLDGSRRQSNGGPSNSRAAFGMDGAADDEAADDDAADPNQQLEMEIRGARGHGSNGTVVVEEKINGKANSNGNGAKHEDEDEDVEMS